MLCSDQLIAGLTNLFTQTDPNGIDEAVAQAKRRVIEGQQQAKRNGFAKLFDTQIQVLKDRGCPEQIIEILTQKREAVLAKATGMNIGSGHIPFLPVIPVLYLGTHGLVAMVRNGGKTGYTYLDPNEIQDVVETPKSPYYIFDVEDGDVMRGKSPLDAERIIKQQNRSCLTAAEAVALCIHTDVLNRHYVDATGSRCVGAFVPAVCLVDGQPWLCWGYADYGISYWGSASCGSRA